MMVSAICRDYSAPPHLKWLGIDFIWLNPSNQHAWFKAAKTSRTNPYHDFYIWQPNHDHQPPNNWTNFTGESVWTYNQATDEWYFHLFAPEQPDLNWENPSVQTEMLNMITWWSEQNIDGFRLDALSHLKKVSFETPQPTGDQQFDIFANNPGIEKFLARLHDTFQSLHLMTVGEAGGVHADTARNWTGPEGFIDMIFELEHQARQSEVPPRADIHHLLSSLTTWSKQLNSQGWLGLYLENHDQPRSLTIYGDNQPLAAKSLATLLLTLRGTPFIYQGEELGMTNMPFTSLLENENLKDTFLSLDQVRGTYWYGIFRGSRVSQLFCPSFYLGAKEQKTYGDQPDQIDDPPTYHAFQRLKATGMPTDLALKSHKLVTRQCANPNPMQWTTFGFSDNASDANKTWLVTNPNTTTRNYQESRADPDSILNYYRRLIHLRRHDDTLKLGDFQLIALEKTKILVFTRNTTVSQRLIVINLSDAPQTITLPEQLCDKAWQPLLATSNPVPELSPTMHLQPYQSIIWSH